MAVRNALSALLSWFNTWLGRAFALAAALAIGILAGMVVQQQDLPNRIYNKLVPTPERPWVRIETNVHTIETVTRQISRATAQGGAIAEVGDNIVIASPKGALSYLDRDYQLHVLNAPAQMNMDALRRSPLFTNVLFDVEQVRLHDLLAVQSGEGRVNLYASFNRFSGNCFDFVVAVLPLSVNGRDVQAAGPWRDVWKATPCVPLKSRGYLFTGMASGGRLVLLNPSTLLISTGDYQFDGFFGEQAFSMDERNDLGKLIELDLTTGRSRHFAIGLRNPEGLTIARDGRIWETEHGPQGGDEVNLMVRGVNYGWPIVTYGMAYGSPPTNWPANPRPGRHDGYAHPRFAFVPSIGISNLIEPDPAEFPNWAGALLLCSLRQSTLYLLRTEGDDIVYAEPILVDRYRLRDIISLHDGRIAILADGGRLILIRNADRHADEPNAPVIGGLDALPPPAEEEAPGRGSRSASDRGHLTFLSACASCHSLSGEVGAGPPLDGVRGRRVASVPGFGYSEGLSRHGGVWTEARMRHFLSNPAVDAPGTIMPPPGLNQDQIGDVLAFLNSVPEGHH